MRWDSGKLNKIVTSFFSRPGGTSPFYLADTTLRDGEQAPGVVFSFGEKLSIAKMLDKVGVEEVEAGSPFIHKQEIIHIQSLVNSGFRFRISCWSRARLDDIDKAFLTGAPAINISFPVSDIHLSALGKDRQWIFQTLPEIVDYAKRRFAFVSLGAQDASRADLALLIDFVKAAEKLGVFRIRIADTVGILNPASTKDMIDKVRKKIHSKIQLEFHGHNDLGMATANSISALQAGANCISATVNGLGERAGNAALEEVIMAIKYSLRLQHNYQTNWIRPLCEFVSDSSGRPLPNMKPVVGEMAFKHESGIHTNSLLKNKKTYQLFDAAEVGMNGHEFIFGFHSGSAALKEFMNKKSIPYNQADVQSILKKIKEASVEYKRGLTETEVESICDSLR